MYGRLTILDLPAKGEPAPETQGRDVKPRVAEAAVLHARLARFFPGHCEGIAMLSSVEKAIAMLRLCGKKMQVPCSRVLAMAAENAEYFSEH